MTKTIAEWTELVGKYADDKGWWEPQCKHENAEPKLETILWCPDCGAVCGRFATPHTWVLPESAKTRNQGELMALFHSEVSEAFEESRNGRQPNEVYHNPTNTSRGSDGPEYDPKPEGIPTELVDVIIRIMDYCWHYGIDIERELERKHNYNLTRAYRHGGKTA